MAEGQRSWIRQCRALCHLWYGTRFRSLPTPALLKWNGLAKKKGWVLCKQISSCHCQVQRVTLTVRDRCASLVGVFGGGGLLRGKVSPYLPVALSSFKQSRLVLVQMADPSCRVSLEKNGAHVLGTSIGLHLCGQRDCSYAILNPAAGKRRPIEGRQ